MIMSLIYLLIRKKMLKNYLMKEYYNNNLPVVIFRPTYIYGIFYAIHSICNITDADYYILARRALHKKGK